MEQVQPGQAANFLRRFGHLKGTLHRLRLQNRSPQSTRAELTLSVREGEDGRRVRLRLTLDGVEEFRFQRRPGANLLRLKNVRLGYFNGLFYLNLDAFADDGPPQLMDFRASDAYVGARVLGFEVVEKK